MNEPDLEIGLDEARRLLAEGKVRFVDCREPDEHAICHLPGARLLPLAEWPSRFAEAFPSVGEEVVVYCHHGFRSLHAVRFLRAHGHHRARSLAGGIDAWSRLVDPTVPRY